MKKRIIWLGLGVMGVIMIVVSVVAAYISNPLYCGSCHLMQTRYISYKRSVHHRAVCKNCHSSPGCVSCHPVKDIDRNMEKDNISDKSTLFAHERHVINMKIACETCHVRMMHDKMDGSYEKKPSETCTDCHLQTDFALKRLRGRNLYDTIQ
jgi:nitrate/TMAO reductase-like tetraheme cytochrome c subunit